METMSMYQKLITTPEEELVRMIKESSGMRSILQIFGFKSVDSRGKKFIREIAAKHKVLVPNHRHKYSLQDVRRAVKKSLCLAEVLRHVGLVDKGGNSATIKKLIKKHQIDINHFDVKKAMARNKFTHTYETIFCENSIVSRSSLSSHLTKFSLLKYECSGKGCKNVGSWLGLPLRLQVDHINGISSDNRIENLRYLCPNCHSQTPTFGSKKRLH